MQGQRGDRGDLHYPRDAKGLPGMVGDKGFPGPEGEIGLVGLAGEPGFDGLVGINGDKVRDFCLKPGSTR